MNAVAGLMQSVGAELLQYYIITGEYHFLIVSEGDNLSDVIAAVVTGFALLNMHNLIEY